jgi:C-terminal processing protease CtpA/Prc
MRRTTPLGWLVLFAALALVTAVPSLASARAWLGVYTQEVTGELRDALDLKGDGVLVTRVIEDSPAARAGVRRGDVIQAVDRRDVGSPSDLSEAIGDSRSGESVSLSINRKGEDIILAVRLAERPQDADRDEDEDDEDLVPVPRPAPAPAAPRAPKAPKAPRELRGYQGDDADPGDVGKRLRELAPGMDFDFEHLGPGAHRVIVGGAGRGRLGVRIETLSEDLASALGASGTRGVLVVEVLDGTPAEKAGLRAGDVITALDGRTVTDADDLVGALRDERGRVSVSIVRRGQRQTLSAELGDSPRAIRLRDGRTPMIWKDLSGDGRKFDIRVDRDDDDLRKELEELREQLRQLREELRDRR